MDDTKREEEEMHKRDTDLIIGAISGALITLVYWFLDLFLTKGIVKLVLSGAILFWSWILYELINYRHTIFERYVYGKKLFLIIFLLLIFSGAAVLIGP